MKRVFLTVYTLLCLAACNDSGTNNATTASGDSVNNPETKSANSSEEAREERNKQTALASVRAFENGANIDLVFKDFGPDMVDYGDGSMAPIKNVDSAKAGLKMWMAAVTDYKVSNLMAVADGDVVMVYGTWSGKWKNDLMGMKATGKSFKVADVDIFTFNDAGKIVEHRGVQSLNEVARQIGMKMPTQ